MRKVCLLVCCVLIFIAVMMTSVDTRSAEKKNKIKPQKKDPSEDKSSKSDSEEKLVPEKTPEVKTPPKHKEKKKQEKKIQNDSTEIPKIQNNSTEIPKIQNDSAEIPKIQNDSTEIPVITDTKTNIDIPHAIKPPEVNELPQTTLAVSQNCSATVSKSDTLEEIERNVTSLWRHLGVISQPVHVHIHGGHVSSPGCHGNGNGHHHQHKDRNRLSDKHKYHGFSHDHSHDHSHGHAHNRSHDHSHSHSHGHTHDHAHNATTSHKHHTVGSHNHTHHGHGDRSHKFHHHSKHHHVHHGHRDRSHKSHHHFKHHSKSHSHTHHGDRSHKSHDHSKHHSPGRKFARGHDHSLSKGHYHKGGYGYGDRSTHVHIHLTLDGQLPPVHREANESESTRAEPITKDTNTQTDTHTHTPEQLFARCDFLKLKGKNSLSGYVLLRQSSGVLDVAVNISGFHVSETDAAHPAQRTHGFHVHEFGDLSNGCLSFGSHYNPEGTTHGGLHHHTRSDIWHVGDWGNIEANDQGEAFTYFNVSDATLQGPHSILGRGIVVHELADDLGEGGVPASKTTGNAGGRLACCIIGHSKPLPAESFQQPTVDPPDPTPETRLTPGS